MSSSARQAGGVFIDGADIRTLQLRSIHSCMAIVSQVHNMWLRGSFECQITQSLSVRPFSARQ